MFLHLSPTFKSVFSSPNVAIFRHFSNYSSENFIFARRYLRISSNYSLEMDSTIRRSFSTSLIPTTAMAISNRTINRGGASSTNLIFYESRRFKGHSHWQNIAKTKMANDISRSQVTGRIMMKIRRLVGKTKETNPRFNKDLANLLDECAVHNIPKDTIKRNIDRAMNSPPVQTHLFSVLGRSGIYLVVEVETPGKTRTRGQIHKICAKLGDFGVADSIEGFTERGIVKIFKDPKAGATAVGAADSAGSEASQKPPPPPPLTLEDAETLGIELECEEAQEVEENTENGTVALFEFTCAPEIVDRVAGGLRSRGYVVQFADSEFIPHPTVKVTPQLEQSVKSLYEKLQEVEGIGRIFDNVHWEETAEDDEE